MNTELSNLIKNKRIEKGLSQRELAKKINVDNATISRIESGLINKISFDIVSKLSKELDIDFLTLFKSSKYTDEDLWEMANVGSKIYKEYFLLKYLNEEEIKKFSTVQNNMISIDIVKVLDAYKDNKIDKETAIQLIYSCEPIEIGKECIFLSDSGNIRFENPFI